MIPAAKLQQLRYFVLGAELRSYRAAAERAARSQPAISLAPREPRGLNAGTKRAGPGGSRV